MDGPPGTSVEPNVDVLNAKYLLSLLADTPAKTGNKSNAADGECPIELLIYVGFNIIKKFIIKCLNSC